MNEIYLDNSATTRPFDEVIARMAKAMSEEYHNPSSLYRPGVSVRERIDEARSAVAALAGLSGWGVFFTSGGTESNNLALTGALPASRNSCGHLITSAGEHPSVMRTIEALSERGYEVTCLNIDGRGQVDPAALRDALRPDTALVSIMQVNNETGAILPIGELGRVIRERAPGALFHVDGVQALGRAALRQADIDLYSVSAHKVHGPKGVGALLARPGLRLHPAVLGGGQEQGLRSGTENTPGILGFAKAAEIYAQRQQEFAGRMMELKIALAQGIAERISDACFNGPEPGEGAPHILNVSFPGLRGEVLLHALEADGIYVSTGSACAATRHTASPVLAAMGLPPERMESAIRFSLSPLTTPSDIDETLRALERHVPRLRRFGRKK
ncbi:MAG: cysteine desulfurase family protein [Christensenellales bacterium]|jgi:cysteine desulfurase